MGERLAGPLARHLHEAQLREPVDGDARPVAGERLAEFREHRVAVILGVHVDEVDDDDPAQIAQPQLAGDRLGCLEVGLEDGVVERAAGDEAAGVHVDRREGLRLVDDEVAAALEVHAPGQRLLDLLLDREEVEDGALAGIVLEDRQRLPRVLFRELPEAVEGLAGIHDHAFGGVRHQVAQHARGERKILVEQGLRRGGRGRLLDLLPQGDEVIDVGAQFRVGRRFGDGAHDEPAGFPLRLEGMHLLAQVLALGHVLDPLRDPDVRVLRKVDQQPPGDGDLRGEPRALGAQGILDHLHEERLPLGEDLLDGLQLPVAVARHPDVGHVQERRAGQTDLDEGRLHAGEHAADAPEVDVADDSPRGVALDVQFQHRALLGDRDPRFLRGDVDEDLLVHRGSPFRLERGAAHERDRTGADRPRRARPGGLSGEALGSRLRHGAIILVHSRPSVVPKSGRPHLTGLSPRIPAKVRGSRKAAGP